MAFELERPETLQRGIRRLVCGRLRKARKSLHAADHAPISDTAVHEARTRLKQVRAALRLIRHDIDGRLFHRCNGALRDAARPLSRIRDAKVLMDTVDDLAARNRGRLPGSALEPLRAVLRARRLQIRERSLSGGRTRMLRSIRHELCKTEKQLNRLRLAHPGWRAIRRGLRRTYERGRKALAVAAREGSDVQWHELRKRAKDLRYDAELLRRIRPREMRSLVTAAHRFTDLLGKDHDLAVLQELLGGELKRALTTRGSARLQPLIAQRRARLQRQACRLGGELYRERADVFVGRVHRYWREW